MLIDIVAFIVALSIIVFVHEYGHYIVGKWTGIKSEVFSIGFGPEIYGRTDRSGVRWKVSAIPLGGYVKFLGDADASSSSVDEKTAGLEGAFPSAPLWARTLTVAAGPFFNFAFSFLVFFALALGWGLPQDSDRIGQLSASSKFYQQGLRAGDRVLAFDGVKVENVNDALGLLMDSGRAGALSVERNGQEMTLDIAYIRPPKIDAVKSGSPADEAGLKKGDIILDIGGREVVSFNDLSDIVSAADAKEVQLTALRGEERLTTKLKPELMEIRNQATGEIETRVLMGIYNYDSIDLLPEAESLGLVGSAKFAGRGVYTIIERSLQFAGDLFTPRGDTSQLGGPIGIAVQTGKAIDAGWMDYIHLIAFISVAIGLINLFPIPVLDGGHLLFYAYEAVAGRPLHERLQQVLLTFGLILIIGLMVFSTYNDVLREL